MRMQGQAFTLTSDELSEGGRVPAAHLHAHCGGANVSPSLAWRHAPAGTKGFAISVHDPDAPRPGGWWHWLISAIPGEVSSLPAGAGTPGREPHGCRQGCNSYGEYGYGGPCPPVGHGEHRYVFTIHALDVPDPGIDPDAEPQAAVMQIRHHALGEASLTAVYGR
jgi:Raf kinase inhibitor-like YbhB/YbcL family protein